MSSISAIDGVVASSSAQRARPGFAAFHAAENVLGMSAQDLRTALGNGQTMADIASSKNIDQGTLISAIATAITAEHPGISQSRATEAATRMVTTTPAANAQAPAHGAQGGGGPRGAGGPPPPPPPGVGGPEDTESTEDDGDADDTATTSESVLKTLAELLKTTEKELLSALGTGETLGQLAASKGVSQSDLLKTVEDALKASSSNVLAKNAESIATALIGTSLAPGSLVTQSA